MTVEQERRNFGNERVKVSTLVEICGNIPGIPVFEAESLNVSPHGMQLRTAYLPDVDAPLVCRFESDGREIVVEGVVAWRREAGRGGEFGVKFTALDSRSVDTLRALCGGEPQGEIKELSKLGEPGARVRLHIEGLGSPMKARVKSGGSAKVQVGSSLEFLKVGKRLEMEDLDAGGRRPAEIDTVTVVVDPSTRVPQLVVGLRFQGTEESTPPPSVAAVGTAEPQPKGLRIPSESVSTDAAPDESDDGENADDELEIRGRVAAMAASAEHRAKAASEKLARASSSALHGASSWLKSATARLASVRQAKPAPRRTTSAPPGGAMSADKHKLRAQSGSKGASTNTTETPRSNKRGTLAVAAGATLIATGTLVLAFRGPSTPPPGTSNTAAAAAQISVAAPGASAISSAAGHGAVTANVPLFGPTPLTTTEPAPLGPPLTNDANVEAQERADAHAAFAPKSNDESFPESQEEGPTRAHDDKNDAASKVKPEDVKPWGSGRMHEPTIHRLRLDGPGAKLSGSIDPTGFTVTVPARKVMESGAAISKRDARIARVRTSNTAAGAQISFRFRDDVPSYRVRLRRDYVEFLISEPSKPAAKSSEKKSKSHSR